jgi:hypothetical protein
LIQRTTANGAAWCSSQTCGAEGGGKADQLAGFEIGADRELTRRLGEPENVGVELFAQRRRLGKLALEFAFGQIFGARRNQKFRVREWASERDEIGDQPARIGQGLRILCRGRRPAGKGNAQAALRLVILDRGPPP